MAGYRLRIGAIVLAAFLARAEFAGLFERRLVVGAVMRERAERIGAEVVVQSGADGTEVCLRLPPAGHFQTAEH